MYDISQSADKLAVYLHARSRATGRTFDQEVMIFTEKDVDLRDARPEDVGPEAAKLAAQRLFDVWKKEDERLSTVFNVTMRSLAVSIDDVRAFSDADTKNLTSQLDLDRLGVLVHAVDLASKTKDAGVRKALEHGGLRSAELPILRTIIIELISSVEGLNLGAYVKERDSKSRTKEPMALRVKDAMKDEIVDRDGTNVLLRDGTLVGKAFRSTKVKEFLQRYASVLRTSEDLKELLQAKAEIRRLGRELRREELDELINSYTQNPMFSHHNFRGNFSGSDGAKAAWFHAVAGNGRDDRRDWLVSTLESEVFPSWGDAWWNTPDDELRSKGRKLVDTYVTSLDSIGGHKDGLGSAIDEALRQAASVAMEEKIAAAANLRLVRGEVLRRLTELGKPATERRVNATLDIVIGEFRLGNIVSSYNLRDLFKEDIAEADRNESKLQAAKIAKTKAKVKEGSGRFRHEAIKAGKTARVKLQELWESLSDEAVRHLVSVLPNSDHGDASEFGKWISEDDGRMRTLLTKAGAQVVSQQWHADFRGDILLHAVRLKMDEYVKWDDLDRHNVVELTPVVPASHVKDAISLLAGLNPDGYNYRYDAYRKAKKDTDKDATRARIDELLSRLDVNTDDTVLDVGFLKVLCEVSKTGHSRLLWKHLRRWGFDAAGKDESDYRNLYMSTAALIGAPDAEMPKLKTRDSVAFAPQLFARAFKKGAMAEAALHLKVVVDGFSTGENRDNPGFTAWAVNSCAGINGYGMDEGISITKLMNNEEVSTAPELAGILLDAAERLEVHPPCGFSTLKKIFVIVGTTIERQDELINLFFGSTSDELMSFRIEHDRLDPAMIAADLSAKLNGARKSTSSYGWRSSRYSAYGPSEARLSDMHLAHFDIIVRANSEFATTANISRLSNDVVKGLSDEVLTICYRKVGSVFSETIHAAHQDNLKAFLKVFRFREDFSTRVIMEAEKITPKQAVICAESLNEAAVKKCGVRLLACVKGNRDDIDEISKHLDQDELGDEEIRQIKSTPQAMADRVLAGDRNLSQGDWRRLFRDKSALSHLFEDAAVARNAKLVKQLIVLAESFNLAIDEAVKAAYHLAFGSLLNDEEGTAVLRVLLDEAGGLEAVDFSSVAAWGIDRYYSRFGAGSVSLSGDNFDPGDYLVKFGRFLGLCDSLGGETADLKKEMMIGLLRRCWTTYEGGEIEPAASDVARMFMEKYGMESVASDYFMEEAAELRDREGRRSGSGDHDHAIGSLTAAVKVMGLPKSTIPESPKAPEADRSETA